LRQPKDRFSTLNQGTGVYCFDTHIRNVRQQGIKISLQYHDEIGFTFLKTEQQQVKDKLNKAIAITNEVLKLNVPLGISIDIGKNYAESH
jgi:DNA polymerase I-like protein with 3'-5' exonuclease and polymerase domains